MKSYKFIILIAAMLPFAALHSQSVTATDVLLGDANSAIVRDYNYNATIACYNLDNDISVFVYNDPSMQSTQVYIKNYYINDFVISNDSVFFCGRTRMKVNGSIKGIVGIFDIQDLFFNSGDFSVQNVFTIYNDPHEGIEYATEFHHLIAYLNSFNQRHVVCVGKGTQGHGCVVELIDGIALQPTYWGYFAGIIEPENSESFHDIMLYDEYVVTAGFLDSENRKLCLRVYNSDFVFDTYGPLNTRHTYDIQSVLTGYSWPSDRVLIEEESTDILTVFTTLNTQAHNSPISLHLASFKLSSLLSNSIGSMTRSVELNFWTSSSYNRVNNIYFNQAYRKCMIMYNRNILISPFSSTTPFCEFTYPLPSNSGTLPEYYFDGVTLQGLTKYTAPYKYMMNGFNNANPQQVFYSMETYNMLSDCAESSEINYKDISLVVAINEKVDFKTLVGSGHFDIEPHSNIEHTIIETQCGNNK